MCFVQSTSPSRQRPKEDIPQEQVARLYQEELSKIMGKRLEDSMRSGEQPFAGYVNFCYCFDPRKYLIFRSIITRLGGSFHISSAITQAAMKIFGRL